MTSYAQLHSELARQGTGCFSARAGQLTVNSAWKINADQIEVNSFFVHSRNVDVEMADERVRTGRWKRHESRVWRGLAAREDSRKIRLRRFNQSLVFPVVI